MSELPEKGNRVIKIKPKNDWPGVIEDVEVYSGNGETYFHIRFDDPGLDDEWLLRDQFIMEPLPIPHVKSVVVWPNGNIMAFGDDGEQIPPIQGSWINYDYLKRLAKAVAKDDPTADGIAQLPVMVGELIRDYVAYYKKHPEAE